MPLNFRGIVKNLERRTLEILTIPDPDLDRSGLPSLLCSLQTSEISRNGIILGKEAIDSALARLTLDLDALKEYEDLSRIKEVADAFNQLKEVLRSVPIDDLTSSAKVSQENLEVIYAKFAQSRDLISGLVPESNQSMHICTEAELLRRLSKAADALTLGFAGELKSELKLKSVQANYAKKLIEALIAGKPVLASGDQYESALDDLIELGVHSPIDFLERYYLRVIDSGIESQTKTFTPEWLAKRLEAYKGLGVPDSINAQVETSLHKAGLSNYYACRAAFLEARAAYDGKIIGQSDKEDTLSSLQDRRMQIELCKEAETYFTGVGRFSLSPDRRYPQDIERAAVELIESITDILVDPVTYRLGKAAVFKNANMYLREYRERVQSTLEYFRQNPSAEYEDRILKVRQRFFEGDRLRAEALGYPDVSAKELPRGALSMALIETKDLFDPSRDLNNPAVRPDQVTKLAAHIKQGLDLIKAGDYRGAMAHFEDQKTLRACSFRYSSGNYIPLQELSHKEVVSTLTTIAMRSWFRSDGTVSPSFGTLPRNFDREKALPEERKLADNFLREVALIYAEEWIHALQHAKGGNVSKKGIFLVGGDAHEHDVAEFMRQNGVPMSELFLGRYRRDQALETLRGVQTEREQRMIASEIVKQSLNTPFTIGFDSNIRIKHPKQAYSWPSLTQTKLELTKAASDRSSLDALQYTLREIRTPKAGAQSHIFIPDQRGIWRKLQEEEIVKSGTLVRIGPYFEIKLP